MAERIRFWCDSGANIHSKYEGTIQLDKLGLTKAEWLAMTDDQRDELMRDIALDRVDWGYQLEEA